MNGDFTRDTFRPARHYQQVLRQQGRVGLDADHNEQTAIDLRRAETTALDLIGDCGGPADGAAFRIVTDPKTLSDADYAALRQWVADQVALNPQPLPPGIPLPPTKATAVLGEGDFILMPGRYYVDGIQCELDHPVLYRIQPDRLDVPALPKGATPQNIAIYLDVWRRHLTALEDEGIRDPALGGVDTATRSQTVWQARHLPLTAIAASPCASGTVPPDPDPGTARLTAFTADPVPDKDPCLLPPEAGYTGLENQLYRVEVHDATHWKWSRENGSVTAVIEQLIATEPGEAGGAIVIDSLGRDENLAFHEGDFVEVLDDGIDLEGRIAQLLRITRIDPGARKLVVEAPITLLATGAAFPNGVNPARHPKVRRWEGTARLADASTAAGAALENGIRVRFEKKDETGANCVFRPRHHWFIPARSATASSPRGDIEWPTDSAAKRRPLAPRGVRHHTCRLAIVQVATTGAVSLLNDCRCLWPSLTHLPRLFYVGGDGQEAVPDPVNPATAATRFKLPQPLTVAVANGHCAGRPLAVRFETILGTGQLAPAGGAPIASPLVVPVGSDGLAVAEFFPDPTAFSQRVRAHLLDAFGLPAGPPIFFDATLTAVSLSAVGGDGQDAAPGGTLLLPLEVVVTGATGPIHSAQVTFTPSAGTVTGAAPTDAQGRARVTWTLGTSPDTQQVVATLAALPGGATPRGTTEVRFTANVRRNGPGGASCCVVVGPTGDFKTLVELFENPEIRKQPDLCVCLQAGEHSVNTALTISGSGRHRVTLHGCGAPTRILLREAPLRITGLESMELRDLEIDTGFINEPVQFQKMDRVLIDGCRIHTQQVATDLVSLVSVGELEIRDSHLETWVDIPDVRPIPGITLTPLGAAASNRIVFARLDTISAQAQGIGANDLPAFVDFWGGGDLMSRYRSGAVQERAKAAAEDIARIAATGSRAFASLLPLLSYGRSLVVVSGLRTLTLTGSEFVGDIHLLGDGPAASEKDFNGLIFSANDGVALARRFQRSVGEWRLLHNDVFQLTIDASRIPSGPTAPLLALPEQLQFVGNTWWSGFVPFLAEQADLSQSQFLSAANPLAFGAGDVGVVLGNSTRFVERQIVARFATPEAGLNPRISVTF
jgi:hypothetical protein